MKKVFIVFLVLLVTQPMMKGFAERESSQQTWETLVSSLQQNWIGEEREENQRMLQNGMKQTSLKSDAFFLEMLENENGEVVRFACSLAEKEERLTLISAVISGLGFEKTKAESLALELQQEYEKSAEYNAERKHTAGIAKESGPACGCATAQGMFFELEEQWLYVTVLSAVQNSR